MYTVRTLTNGLLVIGHPNQPGLAWSHEAGGWVQCADDGTAAAWPVITFDREEALEDYVNDSYLYPRRD